MLELPPHHGFGIQAVRRHLARQVHIVRGGDNLLINGDEAAHDAHCGRCGSLLYSVVRAGAFVHVAIGALIDDLSIRPAAHVFVGSKAPWFTITDYLPQYVGHVTEPDPGGKT